MFTQRFSGRVALVTGGSSGIGAAVCERLLAEGAQVANFDRAIGTSAPAQHYIAMQGDVTQESEVEDVLETVVRNWGRLDIVVHCAGIVGPTSTPIVSYTAEAFRHVVDVNLTGAFLLTRGAIRHMLPRAYGRIVLLASMGGKEGNPGMAGYAASKAGVIGLVKAIGKEYAEQGITVNGIAPAVIATPMNAQTSPDMLKYMTDKIPMRRIGTVAEAAALCCWICSEEASFNTGFVFDLSGGRATY